MDEGEFSHQWGGGKVHGLDIGLHSGNNNNGNNMVQKKLINQKLSVFLDYRSFLIPFAQPTELDIRFELCSVFRNLTIDWRWFI